MRWQRVVVPSIALLLVAWWLLTAQRSIDAVQTGQTTEQQRLDTNPTDEDDDGVRKDPLGGADENPQMGEFLRQHLLNREREKQAKDGKHTDIGEKQSHLESVHQRKPGSAIDDLLAKVPAQTDAKRRADDKLHAEQREKERAEEEARTAAEEARAIASMEAQFTGGSLAKNQLNKEDANNGDEERDDAPRDGGVEAMAPNDDEPAKGMNAGEAPPPKKDTKKPERAPVTYPGAEGAVRSESYREPLYNANDHSATLREELDRELAKQDEKERREANEKDRLAAGCTTLPSVFNGYAWDTGAGHISFHCDRYHELEGDTTARCLGNNKWSKPSPLCVGQYQMMRLLITRIRSNTPCPEWHEVGVQITELEFYDSDGQYIAIPEELQNDANRDAIDGSYDTAWFWRRGNDEEPFELVVYLPETESPVRFYKIVTAPGCTNRDPMDWTLMGAYNEESEWIILDEELGFPTPTERYKPTKDLSFNNFACSMKCDGCVGNSMECIDCKEGFQNAPDCMPLPCKDPGTPKHGRRFVSDENFSFGSEIIYSCEPGFAPIGETRLVCDFPRVWTAKLPKCEPRAGGWFGGYDRLADGRTVKEAMFDMHKHNWPPKKYPKVDLMLRSGAIAIGQLSSLFRSVEIFWPPHIGDMIIILDEAEEWMRAFVPDTWTIYWEPIPRHLPGSLFNQLSNLWADNYTSPETEVVCIMDSDSIIATMVTPELIFRTVDTPAGPVHKVIMLGDQCCPAMVRPAMDWWFWPGFYHANYMITLPIAIPKGLFPRMRKGLMEAHPEVPTVDALMAHYWEQPEMEGITSIFSQFVAFGSWANYDVDGPPTLLVLEDKEPTDVVLRYGVHVPYWLGLRNPMFTERIEEMHQENDGNLYAKIVAHILEASVCWTFPPGVIPRCPERNFLTSEFLLEYDYNGWATATEEVQAAALNNHFAALHESFRATSAEPSLVESQDAE